MNKQFDKLMYDAGMTAQGCWDELDSYQRGAIEKFAELIVRECGNYVNSRIPGNIEVSATVAKMKKHFGVE